ncbi:MAG TPA: DsrE/DsrF/DrsH-like family protein [Dehalococcoidales bacterium]|nr:DsrE/DsrF/DrsH-like family protein [Dehalococcoidales bacterium]
MAEKEKFTLVLFSGDLDKALAAFILATTAASMGMQVTMFFTFWGLNVIKRNQGKIKSQGIMRKMLNVLNRGGAKRLKLSKFNMLGMGTWMMKKMMKQSNYPSIDEFIDMAREMGITMVPCSTSCGILGLPDDAFTDGVMSQAGAAFFLAQAKESKVTLFI